MKSPSRRTRNSSTLLLSLALVILAAPFGAAGVRAAGRTRGGPFESAPASRALFRPAPDMPLWQLINFVVSDLNTYWYRTFQAAGWAYKPPSEVKLYTAAAPINTACGPSLPGNAFYCPASHGIYLDNDLLEKFYKEVGDFTVLVIIAHEWGHAIQHQLGINKSRYTSIAVELQADCFCGAYVKQAEAAGSVEPGDLDEGVDGLFRFRDPKGLPWLDPQAHGNSLERIRHFDRGFQGGSFPCGFIGSLVGVWDAEVTEPGYSLKIIYRFNANGTADAWFTSVYGTSHLRSTWQYANGVLTEQSATGSASGTIRWIDNNHLEITIIQNQEGPASKGRTRHFHRRQQ